jgi:hypothetical protein
MPNDENNHDPQHTSPPEDHPDEPGAEGGSPSSEPTAPFAPDEDDDSSVGDTDQHSDA